MGRDHKLYKRLMSSAYLQDEPIPGQPLIEIVGNCRVLIERHLGITEYGKEKIVIKTRQGHISVSGMGLELISITKSQLVIKGTIHGVSIIRE